MYWFVSALVEVLDPLGEVSTRLLVVWELTPLHEDVGKEFPHFVENYFWLKSLDRDLRLTVHMRQLTLHSYPSTSIFKMISSLSIVSRMSLIITDCMGGYTVHSSFID